MLRAKEAGKQARLAYVLEHAYPSYTTSCAWYGYSDDKIARLVREALAQGFNHFKVKVGADLADDRRRLALVRSIIDDPKECEGRPVPRAETLVGKNAGPTGSVLMIDANQVWDVKQAIEYVEQLAEVGHSSTCLALSQQDADPFPQFKPWFIEEPTAPDDILGHATIRQAIKKLGVGVATGEHAHNRMVFKQLLQADAIDVCQIDSCRLAGVNEILGVLLMAAKKGVPVCPHAGGVGELRGEGVWHDWWLDANRSFPSLAGLCEYVIHLSLIDYIAVSGSYDRNVLEFVDHLHEHFVTPISITPSGHYNVPQNPDEGYSIQIKDASKEEFTFPTGTYWSSPEAKLAHGLE